MEILIYLTGSVIGYFSSREAVKIKAKSDGYDIEKCLIETIFWQILIAISSWIGVFVALVLWYQEYKMYKYKK